MAGKCEISHPMYGQEGGGVAYTDWKPFAESEFWEALTQMFETKHRSRIRIKKNGAYYLAYADAHGDHPEITSRITIQGVEREISLADVKTLLKD